MVTIFFVVKYYKNLEQNINDKNSLEVIKYEKESV